MRLQYYVSPYSPSPQLYDGSVLMTKKVFTRCKKDAKYLLKYFSVHYDDRGKEYIKITVPPAFEGHILNQFNDLFNIKE